MMRGRTAGIITRLINCGVVSPKLRPAWRYIGGTLRTPFMTATMIGKSEARKIRKIGAALLTPNQITASGIQASGEMGRSIWIRGLNALANGPYQPRRKPSGMPMTMAAA